VCLDSVDKQKSINNNLLASAVFCCLSKAIEGKKRHKTQATQMQLSKEIKAK
jgi:hypothetical protein